MGSRTGRCAGDDEVAAADPAPTSPPRGEHHAGRDTVADFELAAGKPAAHAAVSGLRHAGSGVNRGVPSAGVPQVVSLTQAVAIGFARSPLLASARATIEIDTAPVDLAKTAVLPLISGSVSTARNYRQVGTASTSGTGSGTITGNGAATAPAVTSNGLSVDLRQLIYDGGKVAAELRAAKATESGSISTYKRELQTVAFNVANAYYAALSAQRTTQVANETVRLNQVNADLVAAQIAAGTTARSDLLTAELPVAQARVALVRDQGLELSAQAAFVNAMGLDANTYALPQDDGNVLAGSSGAPQVPVPTYDVAIARAYMLRPDFYAQQYSMRELPGVAKSRQARPLSEPQRNRLVRNRVDLYQRHRLPQLRLDRPFALDTDLRSRRHARASRAGTR